MTDPVTRPGGLNVPARPLDAAQRRGRVWLVLAAGAAMVMVAVLGGRLGPDRNTAVAETPSPSITATRPPSPRPSATPVATASLPILPSETLPFPATATFVLRAGDDAELVGWRSGAPRFESLAVVSGAFADLATANDVTADLSPDGRYLAVMATRRTADGQVDGGEVRLLSTSSGTVLETIAGLPAGFPGLLWAPTSRALVVALEEQPWPILAIDTRDRVTVTPYRLPDPLEPGSAGQPVPVGFSADGRSLFVGRPERTTIVAAFQVDTATGRGRAIERYPTRGDARLVPADWTPSPIDPVTGRVLVPFDDASPGTLTVYEPDGRRAFDLAVDSLSGAVWTGDGRIALLELDATIEPPALELLTVGDGGRRADPILALPNTAGAGLLAARDGYAVIALLDEEPEMEALLILVRLADAATSTVRVTGDTLTGIVAFDWIVPPA